MSGPNRATTQIDAYRWGAEGAWDVEEVGRLGSGETEALLRRLRRAASQGSARARDLAAEIPAAEAEGWFGAAEDAGARQRIPSLEEAAAGMGESNALARTARGRGGIDTEAGRSEAPDGELVALTALYLSTGGCGWTRRGGWDQLAPLCSEGEAWTAAPGGIAVAAPPQRGARRVGIERLRSLLRHGPCDARAGTGGWEGVVCLRGRVLALSLARNNMRGSLPPEVALLERLETLALPMNALHGRLPAEVGAMRALTTLSLHDNALEGPLPHPVRGGLAHLAWVALHNNDLADDEWPAWLCRLRGLAHLSLANNPQLRGRIGPDCAFSDALTALHLTGTALTGSLHPRLAARRGRDLALCVCAPCVAAPSPRALTRVPPTARCRRESRAAERPQ